MKNKRFTVGCLAAVLLIAAYFVTNQTITPKLAFVSSLSVLVFAAPSYCAVLSVQGRNKGLWLLLMLGIYALFIESLAIKTGFPYGDFTYENVLGNKVFGLTPWTVAFAYPPILLLAYYLSRQLVKGSTSHIENLIPGNRGASGYFVRGRTFHTLLTTALIAMLIDLVLDPAAVRLGFWHWDKPGFFYGVPLVNFLGWLLTGFIGAILLHCLWGQKTRPTPGLAYSGQAILWFWTGVNLWLGQWLPGLLGIVVSGFLIRLLSLEKATIKK